MLSEWIRCVLQASQPWISTQHIDKGAIWFSEISDQLRDTAAGIVCLTQENKNKPWILFETGALAKGLSANRVCTFLVDLTSTDIEDPLAQFNHTTPDRPSVWGLVSTLNNCLENGRLDERILRQVFDTYWPKFEADFSAALEATPQEAPAAPRSDDSILAEILANTRVLAGRVRELEAKAVPITTPDSNFSNFAYSSKLYRLADAAKDPNLQKADYYKLAEVLGINRANADGLLYTVMRDRDQEVVDALKVLRDQDNNQ
jgi:hypothetical protein